MAVTNPVIDQLRPASVGNSGFGILSGRFTDASPTYAEALAVVSGHFQTVPPPRITYVLTGTANTYAFIAFGRVF